MSGSITNSYSYSALQGERDIRLITLLRGSKDDPISLTIQHVSLNTKPKYKALSYVWGPQTPSYSIQCDGCVMSVGRNLKDALLCLRNVDEDSILWIDRICINQEDTDERTQQVGLMADIYSSALLVVIWLGPADENTQRVIDHINDLHGQMLKFWKIQQPANYTEAKTANHPIRYPPPQDPAWLALRALLQRPWFSRIWTFQEIVLAQDAVLCCGAYTLRWKKLEALISGLNAYSEGPNAEDSRMKGDDNHFMAIFKARSRLRYGDSWPPEQHQVLGGLLPLLHDLRNRQATDPRDKVFALLNVAYDSKNSDLKADYRKSHVEVYAMTVKWFLRTQKSLAFLSLVEKKDKPDLISWIPDFRFKDEFNFLHAPAQVYRGEQHIYRASGSTKAVVKEDESDFQLTVRGIWIGTIVARTDPPGNLTNNVAIGAKALDGGQWHQFARASAENGVYAATGESVDLAYHRIRIWDQMPGEGLARLQRTSPPSEIPQPGLASYDYSKDAIVHGARDDVAMSIIRYTTRKRLFKTDTGLLGTGHRSLELGDKVFVLMGADMPCILRPIGGNYFSFGGESYVHGVMDGETLVSARTKKSGMADSGTSDATDLSWTRNLGDEPWPFDTDEIVLV